MTYNVFSGTLNPTQSINPLILKTIIIAQMMSTGWEEE